MFLVVFIICHIKLKPPVLIMLSYTSISGGQRQNFKSKILLIVPSWTSHSKIIFASSGVTDFKMSVLFINLAIAHELSLDLKKYKGSTI